MVSGNRNVNLKGLALKQWIFLLYFFLFLIKCFKMLFQGCNKQAGHLETGTIFSPGFHLSKGPGGKVVDRGK